MRENKVVLPLIIFLLILVLPFSGYGLYYQIKEKIRTANPNHLAKIGDLLYFYNAKNKLVGTYNCVSSRCEEARSTNDESYLYYNRENKEYTTGVFNKYYVFITDEDSVKLYNLKTKKTINTFKSIKFYNTRNTDYIIVKTLDEKYGLFSKKSLSMVLPANYSYLGINNNNLNSSFDNLRLVTSSNNKYYIISSEGNKLSNDFTKPIYDYNYDVIVINNSGIYDIYDYNMVKKNISLDLTKIEVLNGAIIMSLTNNSIIIYNKSADKVLKAYDDENTRYSYKVNDNGTITILNTITKREIDTYTIGA